MIDQGTDGMSRGFLGEEIMSGETMVSFIPILPPASDRSSDLVTWIKDWADPGIIELKPINWFDVGRDFDGWDKSWDGFDRPWLSEGRTYLWSPPFTAESSLNL